MGIIEHVALALMTPVHIVAVLLSLGTFGFAVGCAHITLGRHELSADAMATAEARAALLPGRAHAPQEPAWRRQLHAAPNFASRVEMHYHVVGTRARPLGPAVPASALTQVA